MENFSIHSYVVILSIAFWIHLEKEFQMPSIPSNIALNYLKINEYWDIHLSNPFISV